MCDDDDKDDEKEIIILLSFLREHLYKNIYLPIKYFIFNRSKLKEFHVRAEI